MPARESEAIKGNAPHLLHTAFAEADCHAQSTGNEATVNCMHEQTRNESTISLQ